MRNVLMKTTIRTAIFSLALASQGAFAEDYVGVLTIGGAIDGVASLTIKTDDGKTVEGFCTAVCKDLSFTGDKDGVYTLKKRFTNKRVSVTIVMRKNTGNEIAVADEDEVLPFITQLKFLK
jgi:hypothetical protein